MWKFSNHAKIRTGERGFSESDILKVLDEEIPSEGYPLDSPSYHILYFIAWKLKNTHEISWNSNLNIVMSKIAGTTFSGFDGRKDSFVPDALVRNSSNLANCIAVKNAVIKYRSLPGQFSIGRTFHCRYGFVLYGGLPVKKMVPVLLV
jgi:hypothetical protein